MVGRIYCSACGVFHRGDHKCGMTYTEMKKTPDQTKKADAGKPLFSCLMRELAKPLSLLVDVLTFGAKKYARSSWMTVDNAEQRYEDALYRHLNAWARGEKADAETGISHLAHAAINILFLLHFELEKKQ